MEELPPLTQFILPSGEAEAALHAYARPLRAAELAIADRLVRGEVTGARRCLLPRNAGGLAAATLHMARSVCRRAERAVVPLVRDSATDAAVGVYLNRLSDYLFTAARYAALKAGEAETVWVKAAPPTS